MPQPVPVMMEVVVEHMKAHNVKTVAFIGLNDSWGDLVFKGIFLPRPSQGGISVVTNGTLRAAVRRCRPGPEGDGGEVGRRGCRRFRHARRAPAFLDSVVTRGRSTITTA